MACHFSAAIYRFLIFGGIFARGESAALSIEFHSDSQGVASATIALSLRDMGSETGRMYHDDDSIRTSFELRNALRAL